MPSINVYLSEDEYVKLVHLALDRQVKATALVRIAVRSLLAQQKAKGER
jgi:hypothetical protein